MNTRATAGVYDGPRFPESYSVVSALRCARSSTSSVVPAASASVAPSDIPFLNSDEDLPTDRASSGSFFAPNNRTRTTRTTIHSGPGLYATISFTFLVSRRLRVSPQCRRWIVTSWAATPPRCRGHASGLSFVLEASPLSPVPRGREGSIPMEHGVALPHPRRGVFVPRG